MATNVLLNSLGLVDSLRASMMLAWREIVRFLRQRHRVIGALGQPIVFWLLFGAGMHRSFRLGTNDATPFWQYYFPGTVILVLLFTAIFATISIIEDRREGFLQGILVSPVRRWVLVTGKLGGVTLLAVGQALLLLLLSTVWGVWPSLLECVVITLFLALVAVAFAAMGFMLAWRMDSTQGFHAIMNLVLIPLWLLSGAFFPVPSPQATEPAQWALHWLMRLNPVTYAVTGLRRMMYRWTLPEGFWEPNSVAVCWIVTAVFSMVMMLLACRMAEQPVSGEKI